MIPSTTVECLCRQARSSRFLGIPFTALDTTGSTGGVCSDWESRNGYFSFIRMAGGLLKTGVIAGDCTICGETGIMMESVSDARTRLMTLGRTGLPRHESPS